MSVFVQAAKDVAWSSTTLEQEVASACRRIGADIGVPWSEMASLKGPGGGAIGACDPVIIRLHRILAEGMRLWVTVGAPVCRANDNAWRRCAARCDARCDPTCSVACRVHAQVHADCTSAHVRVRAMQGADLPYADRLIATLQANLPTMVHAQLAMGERLAPEIAALQQAGRAAGVNLRESKAADCLAASRSEIANATKRTRLSIRASDDFANRSQGR